MSGLVKLQPGEPIKVTFESISFSYPSRKEKRILNNVSFAMNAGKTVALLGSSGSGKTNTSFINIHYDILV